MMNLKFKVTYDVTLNMADGYVTDICKDARKMVGDFKKNVAQLLYDDISENWRDFADYEEDEEEMMNVISDYVNKHIKK